VELAAVGVSLC
jgi:hypothetical protein